MIGGGVPGAACCLGATAARARGACRAAAGTATKCTRSGPRRRPEKRSCSSSQPPAQTGSEARSPCRCRARGRRGRRAPPMGSSARRAGAPGPRSGRGQRPARGRRAGRSAAARAAPGSWHPRNPRDARSCRSRAPAPARPRPKALNGRASSDPRPAAAPRTRARRRVIVVAPTAARVARGTAGATRARSPATGLRTRRGGPSCGRVGGAAGARRRRRRARGPAPARCRTRRPASARRSSACPR